MTLAGERARDLTPLGPHPNLAGALEMKHAIFYGAVGMLGSVLGNRAAKLLLSVRPSYLIFLLAFLLFASGLLLVASGGPRLLHTGFTAFRPLCGRVGAAARLD